MEAIFLGETENLKKWRVNEKTMKYFKVIFREAKALFNEFLAE